MVRKPNRRGHAGGCLLPNILREDGSAVTLLGKHYTACQAGHAGADNCDSLCHITMV
jgi:hypothetical protein